MSLPNPCTTSYNGFTFPTETETVGFDFRCVPDAAGRTITHTVVSIRLKAKILQGANQDTTLDAIRAALTRPGGEFVYSGRGQGDFTINTAGNRRDLAWGPMPRMLSWRPVGRAYAAEIIWQVEVALIDCDDAPFRGAVMEACYSLNISTDKGGYTTRTHSGLIRIPMTRKAAENSAIPDTIDSYFEDWVPPTYPGFERTISRNIEKSKAEMTFTVTDVERAGSPLPVGVIESNVSHDLTSEGKIAGLRWIATLSATYETAKGVPRSDAWKHFIKLAADRIGAERRKDAKFFPTALRISEPEVNGRSSASFSLTYRLIRTRNGKNGPFWFPLAGLWRPVPNTNWNLWSQSLDFSARHPLGLARMQHQAKEDAIVDLCLNREDSLRNQEDVNLIQVPERPIDQDFESLTRELGIDEKPDPASTWLEYECELLVEPSDSTMVHVPLPTEPVEPTTSRLRTPGFPHTGPTFRTEPQETPEPIVQHGPSTVYYVRLIGRAIRYHYEIPRPELKTIGGDPCFSCNHPSNGTYWTHFLGGWTTHAIYCAEWNLRYVIARKDGSEPTFLPIPGHPYQQKDPEQR